MANPQNRIHIDKDEKTNPVGADRVALGDSGATPIYKTVWTNITNLATTIFSLKNSDNLTEGAANRYYTTARAAEKAEDDEVVKLTGDQSISGIKSGSFNINTTGDITATNLRGDGSDITGISTEINSLTEDSGIANGDQLIYYNGADNVKIDYEDLSSTIRQDVSFAFLQTTRNSDDATGSVNIPHGLGVTPKYCIVDLRANVSQFGNATQATSHGYSDGVNNKCIATYDISSTNISNINRSGNCIYWKQEDGGGSDLQTATITMDSTNITLNWTLVEGSGGAVTSYYGFITIFVYA